MKKSDLLKILTPTLSPASEKLAENLADQDMMSRTLLLARLIDNLLVVSDRMGVDAMELCKVCLTKRSVLADLKKDIEENGDTTVRAIPMDDEDSEEME